MCGIAGFNWADRELIARMNHSIRHRGPDGERTVVWDDFSLGHTRLTILDLTDHGNQPMASDDDSLWITYNGEIYNHLALKDELSRKGHEFRSRTDTEVILHCFAEEGTKCFSRFNGIFAFCLVDRKNSAAYLVRDRLGIKPLYFHVRDKRFIFSSEIKAFREAGDGLFIMDEHAVLEYFLTMNISSESFFAPIHSLEPAHYLRYDLRTNQATTHEYSSVFQWVTKERFSENQRRREDELIDELDALLNKIVKDQLMADVPVGTICSGGVDSSLLTAIAKKYSSDLKIFNVRVGDGIYDESKYAGMVARHLGLRLIEEDLDQKAFLDHYRKCIELSDLPLIHPNAVGIFLISRKAKTEGIKVLLSGEGADELFGGYPKYKTFYARARMERFPLYRTALKRMGVLRQEKSFARYLIEDGMEIIHRYGALPWTHYREKIQQRFLEKLSFVRGEAQKETLAFMLKDLKYYLMPILLRADRMSMGAGLEMRVPFLDHRMVDFAVNLPLARKIGIFQTKRLLKKVAERYLPREIVYRKKMGFLLPAEKWLQTDDVRKHMFSEWKKINGSDWDITLAES